MARVRHAEALWTVPALHEGGTRPPRSTVRTGVGNPHLGRPTANFAGRFRVPRREAGRGLSQMALAMMLRQCGRDDVTVHGFRSALRDWAAEETDTPREIAEAALAHAVGDATERAYRRGDALGKRRVLMDAWGAFCFPDGRRDRRLPQRSLVAPTARPRPSPTTIPVPFRMSGSHGIAVVAAAD